MRRPSSRGRRPAPRGPQVFNAWITLAFLVLALVMLLLLKDRLGDSAASCYMNMSGESEQASPDLEPAPEPNVRVKPPE